MTAVPIPAVAVRIAKPMNPMSTTEFRSDVVNMPGSDTLPPLASTTLRDAILSANKLSKASDGFAVGVFHGRTGAYSVSALGETRAGGVEPLRYEFQPDGPIGGPYTDRFERTQFGAGMTDAAALEAIVGANTFAAFADGYEGKVTPLEALDLQAPAPAAS